MILTVTPNPAIDMTYYVESFERGESLRVDTGIARAGGKGLNVARVARQVGGDTLALTTAGGETGHELEADLIASALPYRLVPVAAATRRSVAVVEAAHRSTTIMNERGAALTGAEWRALLAAATEQLGAPNRSGAGQIGAGQIDAGQTAAGPTGAGQAGAGATGAVPGCVVGSGSLPPGVPDAFYADLVTAAAARGLPVVIDAVGPALLKAARAGADVVKPNRAELLETTGESDPAVGARILLDAGARLVLVSLGEDGMLIIDAHDVAHPLHARLPRALDGNPTGAGDAAVAAVAISLAEGALDPVTILRRATAWSAAAVLMPVAGAIAENYRELERLLILEPWTA
ncbi:1-phosphofructokinase family hexose kinase [Rathayibacter soli]|uniref:1-phosphofructokinase family hexose kinase n=1 Tax=Rathayibacter soli TaxID=3144168 RepID=UPI0027E55C83|nr:PfkB family carbohydrate kinase [Glaciibacter superstes]